MNVSTPKPYKYLPPYDEHAIALRRIWMPSSYLADVDVIYQRTSESLEAYKALLVSWRLQGHISAGAYGERLRQAAERREVARLKGVK